MGGLYVNNVPNVTTLLSIESGRGSTQYDFWKNHKKEAALAAQDAKAQTEGEKKVQLAKNAAQMEQLFNAVPQPQRVAQVAQSEKTMDQASFEKLMNFSTLPGRRRMAQREFSSRRDS